MTDLDPFQQALRDVGASVQTLLDAGRTEMSGRMDEAREKSVAEALVGAADRIRAGDAPDNLCAAFPELFHLYLDATRGNQVTSLARSVPSVGMAIRRIQRLSPDELVLRRAETALRDLLNRLPQDKRLNSENLSLAPFHPFARETREWVLEQLNTFYEQDPVRPAGLAYFSWASLGLLSLREVSIVCRALAREGVDVPELVQVFHAYRYCPALYATLVNELYRWARADVEAGPGRMLPPASCASWPPGDRAPQTHIAPSCMPRAYFDAHVAPVVRDLLHPDRDLRDDPDPVAVFEAFRVFQVYWDRFVTWQELWETMATADAVPDVPVRPNEQAEKLFALFPYPSIKAMEAPASPPANPPSLVDLCAATVAANLSRYPSDAFSPAAMNAPCRALIRALLVAMRALPVHLVRDLGDQDSSTFNLSGLMQIVTPTTVDAVPNNDADAPGLRRLILNHAEIRGDGLAAALRRRPDCGWEEISLVGASVVSTKGHPTDPLEIFFRDLGDASLLRRTLRVVRLDGVEANSVNLLSSCTALEEASVLVVRKCFQLPASMRHLRVARLVDHGELRLNAGLVTCAVGQFERQGRVFAYPYPDIKFAREPMTALEHVELPYYTGLLQRLFEVAPALRSLYLCPHVSHGGAISAMLDGQVSSASLEMFRFGEKDPLAAVLPLPLTDFLPHFPKLRAALVD